MAALGGVAGGDPLIEPLGGALEPPPPPRSTRQKVEENLTELADEFGNHLSRLSFDMLDLRFDARSRQARLRLDAGDRDNLRLKLDSDVKFRGGYARVHARVDLRLAGRDFTLDLPEFDVVPASVSGQRGVELRLPILYGEF